MISDLANDPLFRASEPGKTLSSKALGFVDIGARGGVHEMVAPVAGVTSVLAFEPDEEECRKLQAEVNEKAVWASCTIKPVAVAEADGTADFYVLASVVNSSLRKPSLPLCERYTMQGFTCTKVVPLSTKSLDSVLFGSPEHGDTMGEFLKIDTQGCTLDVLMGAERTLNERTVVVSAEIEFVQLYVGEKMFADVETLLRKHGFTLYGFSIPHHRSCKQIDKRIESGRERLISADAIFFRDPLPGSVETRALTSREFHVLFVCSMLFEYYDFALELALKTWAKGEEADRIKALVHRCAALLPSEAQQAIETLSEAVRSNPTMANVKVGRFVDQRRHRFDYDDVAYRFPTEK
jgi:FkbM family methyltransferase